MKRAFVLGGGGSRGAYQIGVWQALRELDWKFDLVCGTSVGAINGAVICMEDFRRAVQLWEEMETSTVFNLKIDETAKPDARFQAIVREFIYRFLSEGGVGVDPLKQLLENLYEEEKIRNSPIDLGIVTVNLQEHRAEQLFLNDIPEGKLVDYVLASSSIFPALKVYQIGKAKYVDGGYYDNLPIDMALSKGAQEIVAVDLEAVGITRKKYLEQPSGVKLHYIKSHWNLGSMLVFDRTLTKRNLRLGYLDGMKAFGAFDGRAYTFLKNQFGEFYTARRADYAKLLRKIGFQSYENSPVQRLIRSPLKNRVNQHLNRKTNSQKQMLLFAMEQAGEIFGLNPEIIYSTAHFNRSLLGQYQQFTSENQIQTVSRREKDRRKRTASLAVLIDQNSKRPTPKHLAHLASIFPTEFEAALYLVLLGAVQSR